jgi:DNA-binding IclR family transcriptional regulator
VNPLGENHQNGNGKLATPKGRSLKTGAETLRALYMLGSTPEGLSAEQLGVRLDRSKVTARYLLNTLCQEGFACRDSSTGLFRLAEEPPWGNGWGSGVGRTEIPASLSEALSELYRRTRQRSYLACVEDDTVTILDARGRQGLPKIPGLTERISPRRAHALAVTKTLAALSPEYADVVHEDCGLTKFTGTTIIEQEKFDSELRRVRENGFAIDKEEFAEGFCCVAAPIFNPAGEVAASLGLSVLARRFDVEDVALISEIVKVAAEASETWRRSAMDDLNTRGFVFTAAAGSSTADGEPGWQEEEDGAPHLNAFA